MRFFGHISSEKNSIEKRLIQVEGKRRRGRRANTWFQDLKDWPLQDTSDASKLAIDRKTWRKLRYPSRLFSLNMNVISCHGGTGNTNDTFIHMTYKVMMSLTLRHVSTEMSDCRSLLNILLMK